jgi:DNA (cytosine-5)-methyltransferase 1
MNELALFAGAGGGILGGVLLGWRTVCAVEINAFCARRLMQGHLPPFPIWDDVCSFDGRPWRGLVDVVSGGFPCQDISAAGKGAGIDGARSGLWKEFARIIGEVRPRFAFVENSPNLTSRGLGRVLGDLAEMGFDARWCVLGADDVGAPHERKRIWIAAHADGGMRDRWADLQRREAQRGSSFDGSIEELANASANRRRTGWTRGLDPSAAREPEQPLQDADASGARLEGNLREVSEGRGEGPPVGAGNVGWWATEPGLVRMVHGVANRVDRIRALGNGQVPAVVAGAWEILGQEIV